MPRAIQFRGSPSGDIVQTEYDLPPIKPNEVLIKITHSGLCGSDLFFLQQPLVLGHEGIGFVQEVGASCSRLKVGDRVGWGLIKSTCNECDMCMSGRDSYCYKANMYGRDDHDTNGSMCSYAVREEQWLFKVPDSLPSEDAAPLMCGGTTVWAPLIEQCKPYERVGIVGMGGLGHLAIQFSSKMGCDVVVFSSTDDKRAEAMELGASEFYPTKGVPDYGHLRLTKPIDRFIITAAANVNLGVLYPALVTTGTVVPLAAKLGDLTAPFLPTVARANKIIGSCVSSRFHENKMLDFASRHKIHAIIEKYPMTLAGITEAISRLRESKMRYRGVISWEYNVLTENQ